MKLVSELQLGAPVQETWRALVDVPRVAQALPGATIEPGPVDGAYRGRIKIKLGPVITEYTGLARLQDVDDDDHVASFHVHGREAHGQGSAEATITISCSGDAIGTRLRVETDLQVTGRQAQLGRGIMEDVATRVLAEFAARLERALVSAEAAEDDGGGEVFDAGRAGWRPLMERAAIALAGVLVGLALGRVVWRR
jgi:carbon monoxide dehydrogenase subunit G